MQIKIREKQRSDIPRIVDYFVGADAGFLRAMGADKNKMPDREEWIEKLNCEFEKTYVNKEFYYLIWLLNDEPIGHSNINKIEFGNEATMHLHLWESVKRKRGLGFKFLKLTIPYFFENFKLETLICEPYSKKIGSK